MPVDTVPIYCGAVQKDSGNADREVPKKQQGFREIIILETLSVVLPGFEPGQAEPKTAVLPLHHETILLAQEMLKPCGSFLLKRCKGTKIFASRKILGFFFAHM